jgi:hypothetical protein
MRHDCLVIVRALGVKESDPPFYVRCLCNPPEFYYSKEEAAKAWNKTNAATS